ncbi:MAG: hypothetical protein KDD48_06605 [Bdellovibrionales bacterium]|nr:hypothetical protein [Bdellovibrionales bacterium]
MTPSCFSESAFPVYVLSIISKLERHGYSAFVVGGCLRDLFLGIEPKDWDIATSATPTKVQSFFKKNIPTGLKYGTITVVMGRNHVQVTTYRTEGAYLGHRKPTDVSYETSIEKDLSRRDFTMNAMAWNSKVELLDPFHGIRDLRKKCLKTVGSPKIRFNEDALRLIRAGRFISCFNLKPDRLLTIGAKATKNALGIISKERITDELNKLLMGAWPGKGVSWLLQVDAFDILFGSQIKFSDQHRRALERAIQLETLSLEGRITLLFYYFTLSTGHSLAFFLKTVRFSNLTKDIVRRLFLFSTLNTQMEDRELRAVLVQVGSSTFPALMAVYEAFLYGKYGRRVPKSERDMTIRLRAMSKEPIYKLAINGIDIQRCLNLSEGEKIGYYLNRLHEAVLENPKLNNKPRLKRLLLSISS